jgi:hypothetical protein
LAEHSLGAGPLTERHDGFAANADWPPPRPQWPVAASHPIPLPANAPIPPRALGRRRPRAMLFIGGCLSLVVALVLGSFAWRDYHDSHGPAAVAKRFFTALSDGDAATALGFAESPPSGQYLTNDVLRMQLKTAKLTDVLVSSTVQKSNSATVALSYVLHFADHKVSQDDSVELVRHGSSWRLRRVASEVTMPSVAAGADRVTFAGRPLGSGVDALFPGAMPVATDTGAAVITGDPRVRLADATSEPGIAVQVSAATRSQVAQAVDAALAGCLAAASNNPLCPAPSGDRAIPGTLHGTLTSPVRDSTSNIHLGDTGIVDVNADVTVRGTWQVWNFNNQQVNRRAPITLTVRAECSVDDPTKVFWVATGD